MCVGTNISGHDHQNTHLTTNVHIHYTHIYASWLNQVEIWFVKIQRDVIARGIFPSTKDLNEKIMGYIHEHNKNSKPIRWN